jgi:hypothetical protein
MITKARAYSLSRPPQRPIASIAGRSYLRLCQICHLLGKGGDASWLSAAVIT